MGIPFPESYGGSGGDTISYALSVEEIGKACGSTGLSYAAAVSLGAAPIYYFGTEEQNKNISSRLRRAGRSEHLG
ncbi:acyl-CoA dehydrogenase family protein [Bacillus licheniformis]|nr:acyl-CoA dehydrogenase family protein [Bacillus licheniformis]